MEKQFHPIFYKDSDYLFKLGLKATHVSKLGPAR